MPRQLLLLSSLALLSALSGESHRWKHFVGREPASEPWHHLLSCGGCERRHLAVE